MKLPLFLGAFHRLFFSDKTFSLSELDLLKFSGEDAARFLQGQLTADLSRLNNKEFTWCSRVDQGGRILFYGLLIKFGDDKYSFALEKGQGDKARDEIEKFIIMDEVEISTSREELAFSFRVLPEKQSALKGRIFGTNAYLYLGHKGEIEDLTPLEVITGQRLFQSELLFNRLAIETFLQSTGISYDKGCFRGQEPLAKINSRLGPSYAPFIVKSSKRLSPGDYYTQDRKAFRVSLSLENDEGSFLHQADVFREFRVHKAEFFIGESTNSEMLKVELLRPIESFDSAHELYLYGVKSFQKGEDELAELCFKEVLEIDPLYSDAYESLGVLLGRYGRYQEAIELMDKLQELSPKSVMAHTNKSLFYMKLGDIEKAEAEKGEATFKSFSMYGEVAKADEERKKREEQEQADLVRKEKMFRDVLGIDTEDVLANFGLGEVLLKKEDFSGSVSCFKKVIEVDNKYSAAYKGLGQALEGEGRTGEAKEIYEQGIAVARKKGDLMPANFMQARLLGL